MKILGIHKDPWHNTGAAIIQEKNGRPTFLSLSEERCDRIKDSRNFPHLSTQACMQAAGIKDIKEFDLVVMDYIRNGHDFKKDYFKKKTSQDNFLNNIDPTKIHIINHHLAHAHSVFYSSPFSRAAILVIDGRGSLQETQSLYIADIKTGIQLIEKTTVIGIGLLYAAITQAIGFGLLEEGKTMGLAPYGHKRKKPFFKFPHQYHGIVTDYSDICIEGSYALKTKHAPIKTFKDKAAAAWEIQSECEKAMLHLATYAKQKTGADFLCISGGVALNSVANYKILQTNLFKDIFINPAASDTGTPLGAALWGYHTFFKKPKKYPSISPYLGPRYSTSEIQKIIHQHTGFTIIKKNALAITASLLANHAIIGFFHDASETGPRALGNRSILMSPTRAKNKDILNHQVKFREPFRPFAPAILEEHTPEYFEIDRPSPFMLFVPTVKKNKRKEIPAVTHVDNTGRLQTVNKKSNPVFYNLLKKFYAQTNIPVLLNTSFNRAGEPIVETPQDAMKCFLESNIDALFIEGWLLVKNNSQHLPS